MKKSKKIVSLLLAATMVASLSACGKKDDKAGEEKKSSSKVSSTASTGSTGSTGSMASTGSAANTGEEALEAKVVVWSPQEDQSDGNWLGTMCDAFAKEHPNWKLTFEYGVCPEGEAKTKVTQDPTAAADVYMYANDHVGDLLAAQAIAELGGPTLEMIKSTNSQAIVDTVTYKDGVYGVPFTSNTWFMFYDKRVFTEDDVKSLDTMLEKGKVSFPLTNSWYMGAFYVANGGTLYGGNNDEAAGVDFGGDKGVAATKYLVNLVKNKNFVNDQDSAGIAGLADGSVNAVFTGVWDYANIVEKLGAENLGVAQLPMVKIDGKDVQMKGFAGSKAIAVNPNTKNPQVAVALAAFLGSEKAQREHYNMRKIIPTNTTLLADPEISKDPLVTAQENTVQNTSITQPFVPSMGVNYWGNTENMGNAILSGEVTEKNAAEMTEKYNNSLNGK